MSSINQTFVIGGSVVVLALAVLVGVVEAGVVASGVEVVVVLGVSCVLALLPARERFFLVGVASGVTGGGWTAAVVLCAALVAAIRASEESSTGRLELASEGLGAGPIAAPTATPRASIPAASMALTRSEGRRSARVAGAAGTSDAPAGDAGLVADVESVESAGGAWVSGGVVIYLGQGRTETGAPGAAFFIN